MKKYLLGAFAIVLAIGFSAFKPTTNVTLKFVGNATVDNDVKAQSNYELTSVTCGLGNKICAVQVDNSFTEIDPNNSSRTILKSSVSISTTFNGTYYIPTFSATGLTPTSFYLP